MSWNALAVFSSLVFVSLPSVAIAEDPGVTVGVGLGLAHQEFKTRSREVSLNSYASPTLKIGWFALPELAILIKSTGTWLTRDDDDVSGLLVQYMIAPAVQCWPTRTVYLEFSPIGFSGFSGSLTRGVETESRFSAGVAVDGAVGFVFLRAGHQVLSLSFDLSKAVHDEFGSFTLSAFFNWQYL